MAPEETVSLITLSSDFGLRGPYVGAMKGVILSRLPGAQIIDLDHESRPQDVFEGAFLFEQAWRYFPPGTVHAVVIDPGVGSDRRRLAIASQGQVFIGPDNGCLSSALPDELRGFRRTDEDYDERVVNLDGALTAVSIENEALSLQPINNTFEGRDVFAPAAAFLAGGGDIAELGPRVDSLLAFAAFRAPMDGRNIAGRIVHADRFGDLVTDIRAADLPLNPMFLAGGRKFGLSRTYAEAGGLTAIIGSSGLVEIALPRGNADDVLGIGPGDRVLCS